MLLIRMFGWFIDSLVTKSCSFKLMMRSLEVSPSRRLPTVTWPLPRGRPSCPSQYSLGWKWFVAGSQGLLSHVEFFIISAFSNSQRQSRDELMDTLVENSSAATWIMCFFWSSSTIRGLTKALAMMRLLRMRSGWVVTCNKISHVFEWAEETGLNKNSLYKIWLAQMTWKWCQTRVAKCHPNITFNNFNQLFHKIINSQKIFFFIKKPPKICFCSSF